MSAIEWQALARRVVGVIPDSCLSADPRYAGRSRVMARLLRIPARGRYACSCGDWIVLNMDHDVEYPLECVCCNRLHFWENGMLIELTPEKGKGQI